MIQVAEVRTRGVKFMSPSDTHCIAALVMDEIEVEGIFYPGGPHFHGATASGTDNPGADSNTENTDGDGEVEEDESADEQADGGDKSLDDDGTDEDPSSDGATSSESESQVSSETRLRNT